MSKAIAALILISCAASGLAARKGTRLTEDQKALHLLNRTGFGPRPGELELVRRIGFDRYVEQQLHPEKIDDSAAEAELADLDSLRLSTAEILQKYPPPQLVARQAGMRPDQANQARPGNNAMTDEARANQREMLRKIMSLYDEQGLRNINVLLQELQAQKLVRAVSSRRQLQEVMVDFWFNHFNVYWPKGQVRMTGTEYEMKAIRPHVLGKFKDLVAATAKSPAMLFYLDNFLSMAPAARPPADGADDGMFANLLRQRKPGINENYARELMELHTLGVDGGYTQKDVQEVARCFTGWTVEGGVGGGLFLGGSFVFRDWMHDKGEKVVLGQRIPAGGGIEDGEKVIDILVHHPSAARFVSRKLVRRFVSDQPPEPLVERVAAVYTRTDGDIREMVRMIVTSPEFYSPEVYRAKVKSPFELVASAIRVLDGSTNGSPSIAQWVARMGEPLYSSQPPTGYPDRADTWVNTGALIERLNFALALAANRIPGTTVNVSQLAGAATDADKTISRALSVALGSDASPRTRESLARQIRQPQPPPEVVSMDASDGSRPRTSLLDDPAAFQASIQAGEVRFGGRRWRNDEPARAAVDLNKARVFGLAIAAPEFQRR